MFQKAKRRQAEFTLVALAILAAQNAQNIAYAQTSSPESAAAAAEKMGTAPKLSKAQRIALAVSAGPALKSPKVPPSPICPECLE